MRRSIARYIVLVTILAACSACRASLPGPEIAFPGAYSGKTGDDRPIRLTLTRSQAGVSGQGTLDGKPLSVSMLSSHKGLCLIAYENTTRPATAQLSFDGETLTISGLETPAVLSKDGPLFNAPPGPFTGRYQSGGMEDLVGVFRGEVTSDEDAYFPPARMTLTSNRDGVIRGWTVNGSKSVAVFNNDLSPGRHVITFSATDSGGLTASKSVTVSVTNDPSQKPIIVQPTSTDTIVATGDVIFEGKTYDSEDGFLTGTSLVWSAKRGSGAFNVIGHGRKLKASLPLAGTYTLRLKAVDSLGASSFTDRIVTVQPYSGNTPPRVTIEKPEHIQWMGIHFRPANTRRKPNQSRL
jgi:hypothetical protein